MRTLLALVLVLSACGKSKDGHDEADKFIAEGAKKDLEELKKAIASPTPGDGKYKCANMANIEMIERADKATATELKQLCTKDLYLAMMKVEVEKAEAARKAKPGENEVVSECFNAYYEFAKDEMVKAKTIDLAKDLVARFEAACPPKK